jgi:hypothetical protein
MPCTTVLRRRTAADVDADADAGRRRRQQPTPTPTTAVAAPARRESIARHTHFASAGETTATDPTAAAPARASVPAH